MKRQNPSIFNDIVGPTMIGPSSSHTCGPSRIGFLCQQLLKGNLKKAVVSFASEGAYALMYKGQRSDMGFVNGLLGYRPEDPELKNCYDLAKEKGVDISFEISDFEPTVPNLCKLKLWSDLGEEIHVSTDSTGGGTVELLKLNDYDISIVGDCYEILIEIKGRPSDSKDQIEMLTSLFSDNEGIFQSNKENSYLINIKQRKSISKDIQEKISKVSDMLNYWILKPILVVPSNRHVTFPFVSAKELLEVAKESKKELWELAIDYEIIRSSWTREDIFSYMEYVVKTMENSVHEALKGDIDMAGVLKPTAGKVDSFIKGDKRKLDMGVMNFAIPWAMATMEYSGAQGVVLCAPTGGSAGVFPGAILGTADYMGLSMEEKIKGMLVTSIIGIIMSKDCNYSAELYGCQVEPGAASGMAAGGLVYLMGGTPEESLMAASCAIQNILGTICDPVGGLVQLPCISRNAMSVANAVVSANMVMGGYDPLIPLDETAETLFRVGKQLPSELRCTCKGGLCTTPTGYRLAEEQDERDDSRFEKNNNY